jgi:hypothetical protein
MIVETAGTTYGTPPLTTAPSSAGFAQPNADCDGSWGVRWLPLGRPHDGRCSVEASAGQESGNCVVGSASRSVRSHSVSAIEVLHVVARQIKIGSSSAIASAAKTFARLGDGLGKSSLSWSALSAPSGSGAGSGLLPSFELSERRRDGAHAGGVGGQR